MSIITGKKYQFDSIYEPSAVQQMADGNVIVVEDERANPLSMVSFDLDGRAKSVHLGENTSPKQLLGNIEDIEGVAVDHSDRVYAISSQSADARGNREKARECLARFEVQDGHIRAVSLRRGLRQAIFKHYNVVEKRHKKDPINIESLDYDETHRRLLIGLRSPLIDDCAVLLGIKNPDDVFSRGADIEFSDEPVLLDLDKGGLRSMVFSNRLGGYLLVSRREKKKFKLWFCRPDFKPKPTRVKVKRDLDLKMLEGICPVIIAGEPLLLLAFDDGHKKSGKGAHYAFLSYKELAIDDSD